MDDRQPVAATAATAACMVNVGQPPPSPPDRRLRHADARPLRHRLCMSVAELLGRDDGGRLHSQFVQSYLPSCLRFVLVLVLLLIVPLLVLLLQIFFPGDFSMLHYLCGLTGGSDDGRCPFRVGCRLEKFLRPSFHYGAEASRPLDVIAGQWELAVWTIANYSTLFSDDVSCIGGEVYVACPTCGRSIAYSSEVVEGSGVVFCRAARCLTADKAVRMLKGISETMFNGVVNAARRLAGGVRGYPVLLDLDVTLQAPVLHCTGTAAKLSVLFVLACLPERLRIAAKRIILAIMGKGKITGLYLREFRELVALLVASPDLLGCELDPVFLQLLQLVQPLNAAWRAALTDATAEERNGAAAIMELAAFLLGPLYEEIKPLDPETKNAKVLNLYLHAPIAHVRAQVGSSRLDVAYVSDDNIEGHLRGIGKYLHNHANNASQAELFCNMAAMRQATLGFNTPRSHPSSMVYTKRIRVCGCWKTLGPDGLADFQAIKNLATDDPALTLQQDAETSGLRITLPLHGKVDKNGTPRRDKDGRKVPGKKEAVRRGLRARQHEIRLCICGKLSKELRSPVVEFASTKRVAETLALSRAAMKARSTAEKVSNATAEATVAAMKRADAAEAAMRGAEGLEASVNAAAAVGPTADMVVVDGTGVAAATTAAMEAMKFETDSDADMSSASSFAIPTPSGGAGSWRSSDETGSSGTRATAESAPSESDASVGNSSPSPSACEARPNKTKEKREALLASVRGYLPPAALMPLVFPNSIVYSTIADVTAPEGEPASSSATVDTVLHEQISILRLFLLRAKTFEFAWWGMRNAVDMEDMTDGAKSLLSRLVAVRRERLLACAEPVL